MLGGGIFKITSVRLIRVDNNRNDHFRYFLGVLVRLIEVSATSATVRLIEGVRLIQVSL